MPSRRIFIETSQGGHQRFVTLERSHSYHHHSRRSHDRDYYRVGKDEWKDMLERQRQLSEANHALTCENDNLKRELQTASTELRRYQGMVPHLQRQIQALEDDNAAFRRSLDCAREHSEKHHRDMEKLKQRLHKAEHDNTSLQARIRELMREAKEGASGLIGDLKRQLEDWKARCHDYYDRNRSLRDAINERECLIDAQRKRISTYEGIMTRRGISFR